MCMWMVAADVTSLVGCLRIAIESDVNTWYCCSDIYLIVSSSFEGFTGTGHSTLFKYGYT